MVKIFISLLVAVTLTVVPALLQGRLSNRWGKPADLHKSGQTLHLLPRRIGPWENRQDERPLSEAVCQELGLTEHFHRRYRHRESGEYVEVLLMVGAPGRLVRHPPDVCYANRANRQIGKVESLRLESSRANHQYKLLHFQRAEEPEPTDFFVAYGFARDDGNWLSPASPRLEFGAAPLLYKLQVLCQSPDEQALLAINSFLSEFVERFAETLERESTTVVAEVSEKRTP